MPNGNDKVWVRTSSAIAAFKWQFGTWPTLLRVPARSMDGLAGIYGGEENLQRIREKMVIIPDEALPDFESVAVEDDEGNRVQYPDCGLSSAPEVHEWLPLVFRY